MVSPRAVRTVLAELWLISSIVVLGVSAYYTDLNRSVGNYSALLTFNLVVATLTILYELIWIPGRYGLRGGIISHAVEAGITFFLWCLWLAAAIAYTIRTRDKYNNCEEVFDVDAGSIFGNCKAYRTLLAFLWLSFVISTFAFLWTIYSATRKPTTALAGSSKWKASFGDASTGESLYGARNVGEHKAGRTSDATATHV